MDLKNRFIDLLVNLGADQEKAEKAYNVIDRGYSESHRAYHTLRHLEEVFDLFDHYKDQFDDPDSVALAIFYHDVVYETQNKKDISNEAASVFLAAEELFRLGVDKDLVKRVGDLIHMTETHLVPDGDKDGALFMDLDMSILAAEPERYKEYQSQIREEFKHVSELKFKIGRFNFVQSTLERDRIFLSESFDENKEDMAVQNLKEERRSLMSVKNLFKP